VSAREHAKRGPKGGEGLTVGTYGWYRCGAACEPGLPCAGKSPNGPADALPLPLPLPLGGVDADPSEDARDKG
jgi:hypothetical protein